MNDPKFTQEQLQGFEFFLEHISNHIESFDLNSAKSNFAASKFEKKWMCQTKSGWKCPYLDPIEYKVLINKEGKILKSIFGDQSFKDSEIGIDMKVETRYYEGCPAWQKKENDNGFDF